jgi:hypothetical protein
MPDGSPLKFIGGNQSVWREWIGNMVPPSAGKAIGDTMLVALVEADLNAFSLRGDGAVWVEPMTAEVRS